MERRHEGLHGLRCGGDRLRAISVGERRTAEELGRAFPGAPVRVSGRDPGGSGVLDSVDPRPSIVVATPGAEPRVEGGYAAALLLDGRLMLDRTDLRAAEEAVLADLTNQPRPVCGPRPMNWTKKKQPAPDLSVSMASSRFFDKKQMAPSEQESQPTRFPHAECEKSFFEKLTDFLGCSSR